MQGLKLDWISMVHECKDTIIIFSLVVTFIILLFSSVYAVTRVNRSGIIACSLPNGVLVATYSFPCTSVKAVEIVEKACDLLRG